MKRTVGILFVLIVVLGFAVLASAGSKRPCHIPKEFCFEESFEREFGGYFVDTFKVVVDQPDNRDCDNASVVGSWWLDSFSTIVTITGTLQQFGDGTPVLMLTGSFPCPPNSSCTTGDLVTCTVYVNFDDDTLSSGPFSDVCMDQARTLLNYNDNLLTESIPCSTLNPSNNP
ncbi:MAG: hypothetical protein ACLPX5_07295 [Dissulfurispiraceae bacterium]